MILKQLSFGTTLGDNIVTVTNNVLTHIFEDFRSYELRRTNKTRAKLRYCKPKFGMEINGEKTKIITNNDTLQKYITMQGQKLESVDHFKYIGAKSVMRVPEEKCSPKLLKQWQNLSDSTPLGKT